MKRRIAEQVFVALEVHAQLEELVFYPAFEAAADEEGEAMVGEAHEEHETVKPGKPQHYDYGYERGGTTKVFLFTEPVRG
jgi:hypothetical protein